MSNWRVRRIDADLWLPTEEIAGIRSASVKRATNDRSTPLLESGDMDITGLLDEGYYRIELLDDSGYLVNIATMLFAADDSGWSRGAWGGSASGRSVLAPAAERKFKPGAYAPKGLDGAEWCAQRLRESIKAPVEVIDGFKLGDHMVFDLGSSYLDGIWGVLDAGGFCMQIAGDGTVTICPKPTDPGRIIASDGGGLMPNITRSLPVEDVLNVFKVYDGESEAIARNDDPASPTSTVSRGREIEEVEDSPTRKGGESLQQYADRRLAELSEIYETYDVEPEYADGVVPYSVVRVNLPEQGIVGDFRVMSQTLECGKGIKVGETWGRLSDGTLG